MVTSEHRPKCPECERLLTLGDMALSRREEDGERVCRGVLHCDEGRAWWAWADQPGDPLESCPYPEHFKKVMQQRRRSATVN